MLISVIVPVYKVEKYLSKCIESIIGQTYRCFELILVDDGSPDNCGRICEEYAEKYDYIRVIHQSNGGQSAARNNASRVAKGDFVTFVDSDDYIEPDYLEYLVGLQQKYDADMSIGGFSYVYEGKPYTGKGITNEKDMLISAGDALIRMNYNQGCGSTPWAKLYRKKLILDHPFPEGQIYEDLATLYKIVGDCGKIALGSRKIYYWVQRDGSTMRMGFDERQMAAMDAVEAQISYIEKRYPAALRSAKYRFTAKAVELTAVCFSSGGDKKTFRRLKKLMNTYAAEILRDKNAKTTMKIRIIAMKAGYYPARIVFGAHEKAKKRLS